MGVPHPILIEFIDGVAKAIAIAFSRKTLIFAASSISRSQPLPQPVALS